MATESGRPNNFAEILKIAEEIVTAFKETDE